MGEYVIDKNFIKIGFKYIRPYIVKDPENKKILALEKKDLKRGTCLLVKGFQQIY